MFLSSVAAVVCAAGLSAQTATTPEATTPIQHVVVIFQENISFDHYFATYPVALNPEGEPRFDAAAGTPEVNGLTPGLLSINGNLDEARSCSIAAVETTCDNDNAYLDELKAYNSRTAGISVPEEHQRHDCRLHSRARSMAYYDGNTVTGLWNYAQHFSMSDNNFDTEFGTTVMGHLNLISGQTHTTSVTTISGKVANGTVIANVEAGYDDCVTTASGTPVLMTGKNIGDLMNAGGVSWGWFYADFPQSTGTQPITTCPAAYNSHYDPFQYYKSTSNQHHLPPSSVAAIGTSADQANHNYALTDFECGQFR